MISRKKAMLVGPKAKRKRAEQQENFDEDAFDGDMDDLDRPDQDEDDDGSDDGETAAEKRLRMAKAYIEKLQRTAAAIGEDDLGVSEQLAADAAAATGRLNRQLAHKLELPEVTAADGLYGCGNLVRCSRLSTTAVALSSDDAVAFSVSKCGSIHRWDIESCSRERIHRPGDSSGARSQTGPEWKQPAARRGSTVALYAVAVSSDDRFLAAGGGDNRVHIWDLRTNEYLKGLRGHKELISGLAFRVGGTELYSSSYDRSMKLWSVPEFNYIDSLFGHQSEVTAVDALRQERAVTAGFDRSCRVWKIPEESQLIFRASGLATDCVKYVTNSEWISGCYDGSVALWSQLKKKPVSIVRQAHCNANTAEAAVSGPGCVDTDAAGWVQSVAVCPGSDLAASGAGDGVIRLWRLAQGNKHKELQLQGCLPARGFVNSIAIARTGKFLVAGIGQEPRLGRWARDKEARNGVLFQQLPTGASD